MSKVARLLFLLQLIRVNRNLNPYKLAEECGVSERTIYRDVKSLLEDVKVPLYYDKGYKLGENTFLPPLSFNLDELFTLWAGLHSKEVSSNVYFSRTATSILTKIESQISENLKKDFHLERQFLKNHSPKSATMKEAIHIQILKKAFNQSQKVALLYENKGKAESYEGVEPKELVWKQNKWNLCGLWQGKEKTFELGKIVSVTLRQIENK